MFAAAYAPPVTSKEAEKDGRGLICVWSLKNQSMPESIIECNAAVLSIDWNPENPSLLAAGFCDGNVAVFDCRQKNGLPIYSTHKGKERHSNGVTVVRWQPKDNSNNMTLLSAGLDGKLLLWTLLHNKFKATEMCRLEAGVISVDDFGYESTHFSVGCDDGRLYQVLKTQTTKPPLVSQCHAPPIFSVAFNRFHSEVYATSGADWLLKIWRQGDTEPLQMYDFAPYYVTDVKFAPYSSTVFGAVTSDGELFFYDLDVNRYQHICKTEVIEQGEGGLTSLAFHPKWPIVLLSDEKGRIQVLKLSPNLRKNTRTAKEEEEQTKLAKATVGKDSRGLLPDLAQPQEEDDDGGQNPAAEEEAKQEALRRDESDKFEKSMGVSWIKRKPFVSALPSV